MNACANNEKVLSRMLFRWEYNYTYKPNVPSNSQPPKRIPKYRKPSNQIVGKDQAQNSHKNRICRN